VDGDRLVAVPLGQALHEVRVAVAEAVDGEDADRRGAVEAREEAAARQRGPHSPAGLVFERRPDQRLLPLLGSVDDELVPRLERRQRGAVPIQQADVPRGVVDGGDLRVLELAVRPGAHVRVQKVGGDEDGARADRLVREAEHERDRVPAEEDVGIGEE